MFFSNTLYFLLMETQKRHHKIVKTYFVTGPKSDQIMETIVHLKDRPGVSKADIYKKVKKIDPKVPSYATFVKFLRNLDHQKNKRTGILLAQVKDALSDGDDKDKKDILKQILSTVYGKVFTAGNIAISQELEEIKEKLSDGGVLSERDRKRIMDWFFKGVDAFNKSRMVDVNIKVGEREQTLIDNLIEASHYGKIQRGDIIDVTPKDNQPKEPAKCLPQ